MFLFVYVPVKIVKIQMEVFQGLLSDGGEESCIGKIWSRRTGDSETSSW
jgi:hypothetical protein